MYSDLARPDPEIHMKLRLAVLAAAAMMLAAPVAASAATLRVEPAKPCFGNGDRVNFIGTGYTPGGIVDFTRDGAPVPADPPITADASGVVRAGLTVSKRRRRKVRTYAARDRSDPSNRASTRVTVSEARVLVRPTTGRPARIRRIAAVGFTTGRTLWAHIVVRGKVPGVDQDAFSAAADRAGEGCPISGALKGNIDISVDATLEA